MSRKITVNLSDGVTDTRCVSNGECCKWAKPNRFSVYRCYIFGYVLEDDKADSWSGETLLRCKECLVAELESKYGD